MRAKLTAADHLDGILQAVAPTAQARFLNVADLLSFRLRKR